MDLGVLNQAGAVLLHRHRPAGPEPFLKAMAPYREAWVVGVAWTLHLGLAGRSLPPCGHACRPRPRALHAGHPRGQGHARDDRRPDDGGVAARRPAAPGRRVPHRAARHQGSAPAAPAAHTHTGRAAGPSPTHASPLSPPRDGPAAGRQGEPRRRGRTRSGARRVQQRIAVERALLGHDDYLRTDRERDLVQTAQAPAAPTVARVRSSPGVGQILALGRRYAIQDLRRCPRGQAFVSACRRVTWAQESAGTRDGPSGTTIGHVSRTWACSDAAGLFWRHHPAGPQSRARVATPQSPGKALTGLAHPVARAGDDRWKWETAVDLDPCVNECWRGAGEPAASRAADGIRLARAGW